MRIINQRGRRWKGKHYTLALAVGLLGKLGELEERQRRTADPEQIAYLRDYRTEVRGIVEEYVREGVLPAGVGALITWRYGREEGEIAQLRTRLQLADDRRRRELRASNEAMGRVLARLNEARPELGAARKPLTEADIEALRQLLLKAGEYVPPELPELSELLEMEGAATGE
jgi:hypothetical protein